jgi:hypothetical protein
MRAKADRTSSPYLSTKSTQRMPRMRLPFLCLSVAFLLSFYSSPRTHHGFTTNSPWVHHELTMGSPRTLGVMRASDRRRVVARVFAGETAKAVAVSEGLKPATVRQWVKRARDRRVAAVPVLDGPEPTSHLEALKRQRREVRANIVWCLEEGKASSLSGLQSLAARLESQIWALEDARALERRRNEDSDPAEDLAAMIEDLLTLPRHMVQDIIDRLAAGLGP